MFKNLYAFKMSHATVSVPWLPYMAGGLDTNKDTSQDGADGVTGGWFLRRRRK